MACFVYAVSLCCTPGAASLRDSDLAWLWTAIVQTLSDGMPLVMLCCSYIVLSACAPKSRLLQVNAFAQAVVAVLYSALPLCVQKITELAEGPESYNAATYFLLFAVGAIAAVLSMFGSLFVSGEELEVAGVGNAAEIEMDEISNNPEVDRNETSSCNNIESSNENSTA